MKIKKITPIAQNKLVNLQLLKSKIYKIPSSKKNIKRSNIKLYIKKLAHIIYEYHINNKTILFINFPPKLVNKLNLLKKKIKHVFISKENWINGFISNNKSIDIPYKLIQNVQKNSTTNQKQFFDLIVVFNPKSATILTEISNSTIPTITITENLTYTRTPLLKQSYKIWGNFEFIEEQINNNFFFSILYSIFKQSILKKTINISTYKKNFFFKPNNKKFKLKNKF
jgi:hypothetical protein